MNYPEILKPYMKDSSKYRKGRFIDEDTFITISCDFIKWYNKNKPTILNNLFEVYELTGYNTSYNVLHERNWKRSREISRKREKDWYTKDKCEEIIFDKMRAAILHLYQSNSPKNEKGEGTHISGAMGSLVSSNISVNIHLSDKRDLMDVSYNYSVKVHLDAGDNNYLEIQEI